MENSISARSIERQLTVFPTPEALGTRLAGEIFELIERAAQAGRRFLLGCPGGRSPVSTYNAMGELFAQRDTDLSHLVIVMMDEYLVSGPEGWEHTDPNVHYSCRRFAREEIQGVFNQGVSPLHRVSDDRVWFPDPSDPRAFEARIEEAGGVDLFILACGAGDGHVAFNPPGTEISARTRIIELAEQTRRDNLATFPEFRNLSEVPTHGVSIGVGTIAEQSHRAVLVAVGESKRTAVEHLLAAEGYDPSWPATVFRAIADSKLYVDRAALSPAYE